MGTDPRSNVKPGDKLRIAAEQVNFLNGLMRPDTGFKGPALPGYEPGRNVILARNSSGGDLDRWGVLAITGIEINPEMNDDIKRRSFEEMPCIIGTMPSATTGAAFCIAIDPIKADKIGRVVVAGVVQVKLSISSYSDSKLIYAKPHASRDTLKAARSGPARILWKPSNVSGDSLYGLVRIDDNGSQLRIGKTTSLWAKNSLASIPLYEQGTPPSETTSDETLTDVVNHWGDVPANKWVGIMAAANGYNYLVVAEC
jgi:hypothetical protein